MFVVAFIAVAAIGMMAYGVTRTVIAITTPEVPAAPEVATVAESASVETITKEKANLTQSGESIIGLRDPVLVKNPSTFTTTTFDTTTYGDRAVLKLTNSTGSALSLTGLSIRGKIVSQMAGQNGYVWEYSDYDAIEKEGEKYAEISNDFIFHPVQAKQIGDFSWKELKPHKLYSLMLPGCHYEYEIGDVYHLTLNHTMNGGTMEDIDTYVEVMGVSINRSVGGVGETNLNLRVPSAAWELTIAKNSKLVGAGNAQRLNNRSNVVSVASSTWTGQADYYCDGTSDNVEIQAAIDYLDGVGGGYLVLTSGFFNISTYISMKANIVFSGQGSNTVIAPYGTTSSNNFLYCIYCIAGCINTTISQITISGENNLNTSYPIFVSSNASVDIVRVYIRDISNSRTDVTGIVCNSLNSSVSFCNIKNISSTNASYVPAGIYGANGCYNNLIDNITGAGSVAGIDQSKKCLGNKVINTATKYSNSYADSGTSYACADTADGGYNS